MKQFDIFQKKYSCKSELISLDLLTTGIEPVTAAS